MYIHQLEGWPNFTFSLPQVLRQIENVAFEIGILVGRMETLGFAQKKEAELKSLTETVLKTSEIEGETLDLEEVRSSIARRLDITLLNHKINTSKVDGVVALTLDATENHALPLTRERLFNWHNSLFEHERDRNPNMTIGAWRPLNGEAMQVVSGPLGRQRVHFEAPNAERIEEEMQRFLTWFNKGGDELEMLKAPIAHLWFLTIHPFDDGNGRIARAITDMQLVRQEHSFRKGFALSMLPRFYSMSAQIQKERKSYYSILERTQKGDLEITEWIVWFLDRLLQAVLSTQTGLDSILHKAKHWEALSSASLSPRQRLMINKMMDGFDGKLTTSKWAKIAKCSQDTALRDIQDLVAQNILVKDKAGGRNTSYELTRI